MTELNPLLQAAAVRDFRDARRKAALEEVVSRVTGRSDDLLSYEEIIGLLKAEGSTSLGIQDIDLDAIVGSVGRYADFTRSFLPRRDSDQERWAKVKLKTVYQGGLPPIEVYKVGEAYFVLDGNHRVSVARALGATQIQAKVTEVHTKVPLSPDTRPDELIIKARLADFLDRSGLDQTCPKVDFTVTVPGAFRILNEQIDVHQHRLSRAQGKHVSRRDAAARWCESVYRPVIKTIEQRGILRDFPGRTETDLYVWICRHREALQEQLGWQVRTETAAQDLSTQFSRRPQRVLARLGGRLMDAVTPDELEAGPATGQWRREQVESRATDQLFVDILVPVSGREPTWEAVEQAIRIAQLEGGELRGLHVVKDGKRKHKHKAEIQAIQEAFEARCRESGVQGTLATDVGDIARSICHRARWFDLVVVNLAHPPGPQPLAKLGSGFRKLLLRCPRPVLAVPTMASPLGNALLAYDGSSKADEALFVAAYLAGKWQIPLTVLTVSDSDEIGQEILEGAAEYLQNRGVQPALITARGKVGEAVLQTAAQEGNDLIIMGGYGSSPVLEVVLGSAVDYVVRHSHRPVLICR